MRTFTIFFMTMLLSTITFSQEKTGYQMPPKAIADLIDAAPTPGLSISPDDRWILLMERANLPSIEEVSQEELRLAGLRINPETNGQSRTSHYTQIKIKSLDNQQEKGITGMPENGRIGSVSWSPDSKHFAFLNTVNNGIELWVVDAGAATAKRMSLAIVNAAVRGSAFSWFSDGQHLIYKQIDPPSGQPP